MIVFLFSLKFSIKKIFSKLKTRTWPTTKQILASIRSVLDGQSPTGTISLHILPHLTFKRCWARRLFRNPFWRQGKSRFSRTSQRPPNIPLKNLSPGRLPQPFSQQKWIRNHFLSLSRYISRPPFCKVTPHRTRKDTKKDSGIEFRPSWYHDKLNQSSWNLELHA